jgi:hypothetical protein
MCATLAACGGERASPSSAAATGALADVERGRLLYENTCNGCHTTQPHWRDQRLVKTWDDLVAQVSRWQANAHAGWSDAEIRDVASFLNARFYRLPCDACGGPRAALASPHAVAGGSLPGADSRALRALAVLPR